MVLAMIAMLRPGSTEAGAVALVVVSGVLVVLAAVGQLPSKVEAFGFAADYGREGELLEAAADSTPESKRAAARAVEVAAPDDPVAALTAAQMRADSYFEERVMQQLRAVPGLYAEHDGEALEVRVPGRARAIRLDAILHWEGRDLAVEIAAGPRGTASLGPVERLERVLAAEAFDGALLVTDKTAVDEFSVSDQRILVVPADDLSRLSERLSRAFGDA